MQSSLFLPQAAVSAIKTQAEASASFDAVAALFWRSRARALGLGNTDIAHFLFPVDTWHLQGASPLTKCYYGAAVVFPLCVSACRGTVSGCQQPIINYAVSKIAMIKHLASRPEYRSSVVDYLEVYQGKVGFHGGKETFVISDQSKLRFADVDFGWGQAVYGRPGRAGTGNEPGMVAAMVSHRLENGEEGLLLIFTMTNEALDSFHNEVLETAVAAIEFEGKNKVQSRGISSGKASAVKSAL